MALQIWIPDEPIVFGAGSDSTSLTKKEPKKSPKKRTKKASKTVVELEKNLAKYNKEDVEEADILEERVLLDTFSQEERAIQDSFMEQAKEYSPKRNGLVYIAENMRYIQGFIAKKSPSRFHPVRRNYIDGRNRMDGSRVDQEDLFQDLCLWFIEKATAQNKAKTKVLNKVNDVIKNYNRDYAKFISESLEALQEEMDDHFYPEFVLDRNLAYKEVEDDSANRVREFIDSLPEPMNKITALLFAGFSQVEISCKLKISLRDISRAIKKVRIMALQSSILDKMAVISHIDVEDFIIEEEAV